MNKPYKTTHRDGHMIVRMILLTAAILSQPLSAGSAEERELEMKRVREKEAGRAKTVSDEFADRESFEKKYGYLKEDNARLFEATLEKRQLAAKAWRNTIDGIARAEGYEQINVVKMPAYQAEAAAEIARLEMKAAASEKEWKKSAEKSGSRDVAAISLQLILNQKAMILATKQHMESQRLLRQLDIDRIQLEKKMRDANENAKRAQNTDKSDKDRKPAPDHGKPQPHVDKPDRIMVE
jgi:fructose-specific phosphotransferase system component IIB